MIRSRELYLWKRTRDQRCPVMIIGFCTASGRKFIGADGDKSDRLLYLFHFLPLFSFWNPESTRQGTETARDPPRLNPAGENDGALRAHAPACGFIEAFIWRPAGPVQADRS